MSHASLAARYRPQTFAEVTGQETVKAILSRAAAEDKVAPAYLLSGTRGVGKTTIARIFAKALNCVHAPTGEPCNQCEQCRRITMGNHVDVVEIDGASNRGIDDARRLREAIAYAPMEGRYKVFIIDEAHMLTRESFNALLKTLEEPPPRATFILATTEAHKFPITIVSRCQHFIFKAIPEAELVAHLTRVLNKEGIPFEENAVRLLARRAAGSVRDSMSLLGQTLALGGDHLTEASTRSVLGLAGQELYERLLNALKAQDCLAVAALTQELLERGALDVVQANLGWSGGFTECRRIAALSLAYDKLFTPHTFFSSVRPGPRPPPRSTCRTRKSSACWTSRRSSIPRISMPHGKWCSKASGRCSPALSRPPRWNCCS